jgi:hypothetical protein
MTTSRAVAIYTSNPAFNPVESYYQLVPFEVADKSFMLKIEKTKRVANLTFESLLDTMATEASNFEMFMLVVHGIGRGGGGQVWRLSMPLTSGSDLGTRDDIVKVLVDFMNKGSSNEEMSKYESSNHFTQESFKGKAHLPAGSVSRIVGKMKELRFKKKIRWVSVRACALGNNPDFMRNLGLAFGARFINAPDVHMFYSGEMKLDKQGKDADLDKKLKEHPRARVFTRTGDQRLAIEIIGTGPARSHWLMTTATGLRWFMDANFNAGHNYPSGEHFSAFRIAGMDDTKLGYALPGEAEYASHIVWSDPLPVSW